MRVRRPVRPFPTGSRTTQNLSLRTRISHPPRRFYSQPPTVEELNQKIKQCKITEEEYFENYMIWDRIAAECTWQGKCLAGGKCVKESNCLLNGQIAYLAWKESKKETDAHLIARNVLIYNKISAKHPYDKTGGKN